MKELKEIQTALSVPKNREGRSYKYRSAEDVYEAVKPLLSNFNCSLSISDDIVCIGDSNYIVATATITNSEGKSVSAKGIAKEERANKMMCDPQKTGSTSSYARKFALGGLLCLDDNPDVDSTGYSSIVHDVKLDNRIESMIKRVNAIKDKDALDKVIPYLKDSDPEILQNEEFNKAYEAKKAQIK